jgi:hypothetical protein
MEGTPTNAYDYGGHPAPAGRALPNLINAVKMLKSKSKTALNFDFDVDFNIPTAFKDRIGLAPQGPGALHIIFIF